MAVCTDHQALLWLRKVHNSDKMLSRWYTIIEETLELETDGSGVLESLQWHVEHCAGTLHRNADGLSQRAGKVKWNYIEPQPSHVEETAPLDTSSVKWKLAHKTAKPSAPFCGRVRKNHECCPSCGPASAKPVAAAIAISEGFENLRLWQQQEPKWTEIIDRIVHHRGRPSSDAINAMDLPTQRLVHDWNKLCVIEGVLCRRNKKNWPRAVVPESKKLTILQLYHEVPGSLYDGTSKMLGRLGQKYYWYNLQSDVQLYVFDCDVCQKIKSNSQHVKEELQPIPVAFPNQRIHRLCWPF